MALMHLVYVSSCVVPMSGEDLAALLYVSVTRNAVDGVTGMLLHAGASFLQVLEGEEAPVEATFARIARDPRHTGVCVVERAGLARRDFRGWHMAFRALGRADAQAHPGAARWFEGGFDAAALAARPRLALELLIEFCLGQGRLRAR